MISPSAKLIMRKIAAAIQIIVSLYILGLGIIDFVGFIDSNYRFTLDSVATLTILAGVLLLMGSINILTNKSSGKILSIVGWGLSASLLVWTIKTFDLM